MIHVTNMATVSVAVVATEPENPDQDKHPILTAKNTHKTSKAP
jgi:hypothetical protein